MTRDYSILELLEDIKPLRILLIDEDITSQLRTIRILDEWSRNIDVCGSVNGAIKNIRMKCYDLIILDLNISLVEGFELTRIIESKSKFCHLKTSVIGLTEIDHPLMKNMSSFSQIDNYVLKSSRDSILINTIVNQCYLPKN